MYILPNIYNTITFRIALDLAPKSRIAARRSEACSKQPPARKSHITSKLLLVRKISKRGNLQNRMVQIFIIAYLNLGLPKNLEN